MKLSLFKRKPSERCKEILEVKRQLQDVLMAQIRMTKLMSQEFQNLKNEVTRAVAAILAAVERISNADSPAEIQAEADKLSAAVTSLEEVLNPPTEPTP